MTSKSLFCELPYARVSDIVSFHGQFNNVMNNNLPTKKYLDKLSSLYAFNLSSFLNSGEVTDILNPNGS